MPKCFICRLPKPFVTASSCIVLKFIGFCFCHFSGSGFIAFLVITLSCCLKFQNKSLLNFDSALHLSPPFSPGLTQAESAGRALGSVLSEMKLCTDLGFSTFTQLYKSLVDSVLFYTAGVWGFEEVFDCNSVQNRALRCFLGVHKYAAKVAVEGDAGWDPCILKQRCERCR